jgi:hypothetical protein
MLRNALILGFTATCTQLQAQADLMNWFDDPFFRVSADIPDCPEPAGPRVSETEKLAQSHRRAEEGTTCWLAKEADCDRNSAFAYDQEIEAALRAAFKLGSPVVPSSLWVTVQGRVVYIEGCVPRESDASKLEDFVRKVPHVQQAVAIVAGQDSSRVPYRTTSTKLPPK